MFDDMVVSGTTKKSDKRWTIVVSSVAQTFLLGILILIPLISYSELPRGFNAMYLAAPPPPPPAPAPLPPRELEHPRRLVTMNNIAAPHWVPKHAEVIAQTAPTIDFSNTGGVAGGPGGSGPLIGFFGPSQPAPPPPAQTSGRIRVGGQVEAARLIHRPMPEYPTMARDAHVEGTVVLHAVIGKDGSITSLQYVSGPALLMKAAEDAVATWRYQPLVLNGEPTEVETEISVVFTLNE